jgi:hypothetical protein
MNVAEEEVSMEREEKGGNVRDGEVRTTAAAAAAVSLETLRKRMADFATERDWEQFHSPRNLLLALVRLLHSSSLLYSLAISTANFGEHRSNFIWRLILIWGVVRVLRICCAEIYIFFPQKNGDMGFV